MNPLHIIVPSGGVSAGCARDVSIAVDASASAPAAWGPTVSYSAQKHVHLHITLHEKRHVTVMTQNMTAEQNDAQTRGQLYNVPDRCLGVAAASSVMRRRLALAALMMPTHSRHTEMCPRASVAPIL